MAQFLTDPMFRLRAALRAAGHEPAIDQIRRVPNGDFAVTTKPGTPPAQITAINTIASGFDKRPYRSKSVAVLTAAIAALSPSDRTRLRNAALDRLVIEMLREFPNFPRTLEPPIALDGDEPVT